jgi:alkylation response protein AidB-like acyl-CoA dehydrogenase/nitroreductase/NAD-dependent dihydropyrimidine dehydrogenase PreA subunit
MGLREMNVELTKEHAALWDSSKKFLGEVWRPASIQLDRLADPADVIAKGSIYWDVMRKTYEMGFHSMLIPKDFGGQELDALSVALITELMGWASTDLAVSWGCHTTPYNWAMISPDPEIQGLTRKFCADKEAKYTGCWAITEPDHGSDWLLFDNDAVGKNPSISGQVRARLDGDEYVLNGQKAAWVSNGTIANHAALWVTLDPSQGMQGGGVCVIPLDLPGISRGKPLNKLGQRALNQGEIFFDSVRIPRKMMVAEDPAMFKLVSNAQLGLANSWMGVLFSGCALSALEEALEYSKTRVQGGQLIYNHQSVKARLFDMFTAVEAARSLARRVLVYNVALGKKMEAPAVHYAMASKILGTETAFRVASQAIQIFGGNGVSKEYYIEKVFRDARAALIEDGVNETLAIDGADRLIKGRGKWVVTEGIAQQAPASAAAAAMTWEEFRPMVRPEPGTVHQGVMKVDAKKCDQCGLCILNCPFRCWEMGEKKIPRLKKDYDCFSCYNCMAACPKDAISIADTYHVDSGFFASDPNTVLARMPLEPKDANGKPDKWTAIEQMIFERRSVRNFKADPVPEPLIRRVIEAGRFAPSSGNGQPWKFIVVTDKALINEMNEACYNILAVLHNTYKNDAIVKGLMQIYAQAPQPGLFDPRIILGGAGSIAKKNSPTFLGAPVVILLACDDRSIGGPQIQAGIAGQNMNLAALSLGLGFCWNGFSQVIELVPALKEKLGLRLPWRIANAMVLGYPKFKQMGIVPREFRPITWFREGAKGPEIETAPPKK